MARRNYRPIPQLTYEQLAKFWSFLKADSPDSCWEWQGDRFKNGYGRMTFKREPYGTHRISYFLHYGVDPGELHVLHKCDNRPCSNPAHLFLGSQADNVADRDRKGRQAKGDNTIYRLYPHLKMFGDNHPARRNPERMARGDLNGARLHPEKLARGVDVNTAKLKENQVRAIRKRYAEGNCTFTLLAKKYGVRIGTVSSIVKRKSWKHIV